jgi:hypothetical protein
VCCLVAAVSSSLQATAGCRISGILYAAESAQYGMREAATAAVEDVLQFMANWSTDPALSTDNI